MDIQTVSGPGVGPFFSPQKCVVYNRTGAAVAIGEVLALDYLASATESSNVALQPNTDIGNSTAPTKCWPLGNAIVPATATIGVDEGDPGAIFGVVTSLLSGAGADDTKVELTLRGVVKAKMGGGGAVTHGMALYPVNAQKYLLNYTTAAAGQEGVRRLGKALHAGTDQTDWILFDGVTGAFGVGGDLTTA